MQIVLQISCKRHLFGCVDHFAKKEKKRLKSRWYWLSIMFVEPDTIGYIDLIIHIHHKYLLIS